MSSLLGLIGLVILVWSPAPTLSDDSLPCYDGTALLPFVTKQITRGSRLIVYQGTAAPQVRGTGYCCGCGTELSDLCLQDFWV